MLAGKHAWRKGIKKRRSKQKSQVLQLDRLTNSRRACSLRLKCSVNWAAIEYESNCRVVSCCRIHDPGRGLIYRSSSTPISSPSPQALTYCAFPMVPGPLGPIS